MTRPVGLARVAARAKRRPGYTLVEIMVATALSLILMLAVVRVFADVADSIAAARDTLEMSDRLRTAAAVIRQDVDGITALPMPPLNPDEGQGYLQITEGAMGALVAPEGMASNITDPSNVVSDSTAGDLDDIVMFTAKSDGRPFIGRFNTGTLESNVAEIVYFVRGRTLYRRTLLVNPGALSQMVSVIDNDGDGRLDSSDNWNSQSAYALFDVSCHLQQDPSGTEWHLVPNTLGDLTRLECRFAHSQDPTTGSFPGHPHQSAGWSLFGLPTLRECSSWDFFEDWWSNRGLPDLPTAISDFKTGTDGTYDAWLNPLPWDNVDPDTGDIDGSLDYINGTRIGEDVLLTNVLSFDVKVWDPGAPIMYQPSTTTTLVPGDPKYLVFVRDYVAAGGSLNNTTPRPIAYGAYVDLNYMCRLGPLSTSPPVDERVPNYTNSLKPADVPEPQFNGPGHWRSGMRGPAPNTSATSGASVYDTWSTSYESDGINQDTGDDTLVDEGTNGYDDDGANGVDDAGERETSPPYPYPLRGIQIKLRTFDPDSRQIREVTIVHDFLPK